MATRSGTLPYGSETREPGEPPAPPPSEVASAPPPPPMRRRFWPATRQRGRDQQGPLSETAIGVVAAAAIWVGLALFLGAWVYRMAPGSRITLMILGGWLLASGTAYVIAGRPSRPPPTNRMA